MTSHTEPARAPQAPADTPEPEAGDGRVAGPGQVARAGTPHTAARTVTVDGVRLARGSRVRLRPGRRGDIIDVALTGRYAEVDTVEEDMEGRLHVAVTLESDEGRHFTTSLGHRFFFAPDEIEPAGPGPVRATRLLLAGIGNMFLADDAFGPETIAALHAGARSLPGQVHAVDFGIRGMDLAYRLLDGYDAAVFVDAAPRGGTPGTLYLIEPPAPAETGTRPEASPEAHGMDPARVLALAGRLAQDAGLALPRVLVLGCEPLVRMRGDEPDVRVGLSTPVAAAVRQAVTVLHDVAGTLLKDPQATPEPFRQAAPAAAGDHHPAPSP